ncbi:MAG TPA: acyl-CoA dehydrogenase family protein [Acidimicrobiales bacterium]|nr:acyl-CoA dehydrogenase family protein [Acidimicrobiales bacterium]
MDLDYPPEAEEFRGEIRAWLEANLPADTATQLTEEQRRHRYEEWNEKLAAGGWICATWPEEYGGRGLSTMQGVVLAEEFERAGVPMRADFFGDTLVGPTILRWGSEEQKREFLPRILSGRISWCQGFSEPDAGSDLASLTTRAVLDGDEWVIHGQKVWTTGAQEADYIFLLARTDPDAAKHAGISYLLVPMKQPGVEVRPIRQPDGSAEFNEVFFDGARCPKGNVVGGVNNGWTVAMTTLGFERGTSATTGHRRFKKELDELISLAQERGRSRDPLVRQALAAAYTKVKIMQINGYRSLTAALGAGHDSGVAALAATNKMFWSEYHQEAMNLAIGLLGMAGQVLTGPGEPEVVPGVGLRRPLPGYPVSVLQSSFFFSRSETIWGGTAQIQRNIVGERILGLPREPRP